MRQSGASHVVPYLADQPENSHRDSLHAAQPDQVLLRHRGLPSEPRRLRAGRESRGAVVREGDEAASSHAGAVLHAVFRKQRVGGGLRVRNRSSVFQQSRPSQCGRLDDSHVAVMVFTVKLLQLPFRCL